MDRSTSLSSEAWIGVVPEEWSVEPLGRWFRERKTTVSDADFAPLSVTMQGIVPQLDNVAKTDNNANRKLVLKGDFAINSRSDRKGSAGVSGLDGSVSVITTVLQPRGLNPRFTHHLLRSRPFQEEFYRWGHGIVDDLWSTKWSDMKSIKIPVPPEPEQRAIADYLDRETAQIDAFIAKNEKLITLLTERRAAVATKAVTRGIDDCAMLKDSGFGWLGLIPEDWEAVRVKFAVKSLPGFAFASGDFVDDNEATRLLRGVNVGVGTVSWGDRVAIRNVPAEVKKRYKLEEGDLVLGLDRPVISGGLRVARIGQGDAGALLVQRVLRLRGTRVRNDYLEYALASGGFAMYIEPDFTGVSVPHMSEQQVGNFCIAFPSMPMQKRITTHIRERHAVIDAALDAARRSIDLMRERRNALISAAVTGKVDVGVAA